MAAQQSGRAGAAKPRGRRSPGAPLTNKQIVGRVAMVCFAFAVLAFAVQGGEYGTTDLLRQRRQLAREQTVVDSLEKSVRLLQQVKKSVESDPVTQERIAREEFGMVKGEKEILYRFTSPADSLQ